MPLKTITFKVKEKQAKDFAGKCKNDNISMYSTLKWLIDKYIKNELTPNTTSKKIEELQRYIETREEEHKLQIHNLERQIQNAKAEVNKLTVKNPRKLDLIKKLLNHLYNINLYTTDQNFRAKLKYNELNFMYKVTRTTDEDIYKILSEE